MRSLVYGALAGLIATVPMTGVMMGMKRVFLGHGSRAVPPVQITERVVRRSPLPNELVESYRAETSLGAHFGYGAALGGLYSIFEQSGRHALAKGIGYGLVVWATNYAGFLPMLRLQPKPENQPKGRNVAMIAAHVVWGAVLGLTVRELQKDSA
jgi:hypothetical protein